MTDPTLYRSLVGGLQYLIFTRHDNAHSFNVVCQYMTRPADAHLFLVKMILRYAQGTLDCGHKYTPSSEYISAFSNANWVPDINTRRSITGYVVFVGDNPVS